MFTITKEFHFSASHVLDRLPSWHPCARMHGHNYIVVLELSAADDARTENGFVRDYRELGAFKEWMDATLDHRHLNESMGGGAPPSAENLAKWIFDTWRAEIPELSAVRISETPKTWAIYRP
ncbi:6-carboxytetrahydropterin synthase [Streptomyces sp. LHD-70]|uniref:6-pyruvoyl trahydropterin synthase family protein n=1 Tax=Streptomyces sp. LHD-70 TaxID=3072140 RepID=UPI00280F905F|nr:6-carboxytetrahydropterin synthase [Streptomyces sp. LHD-70]MDQ8703524.1 6-carboxytetrahydropterin synthase [Streptomyces sp. LHD-70]